MSQKVLSYTLMSRGDRWVAPLMSWTVAYGVAGLSFPPPRPGRPIQQQNKELTATCTGPAHRWCHSHHSPSWS